VSDERLTYRFGPIERRGILGSVRTGQAIVLGCAAVLAVSVLDRVPSAAGALAATTLIGLAIALATVPIGSRTAEQWTPVAGAFAISRLSGRTSFRAASWPLACSTPRRRNGGWPGGGSCSRALPAPR
jgi:hypothetical protein